MKITELDWSSSDNGRCWTLTGCVKPPGGLFISRRKLFDVLFLGRTQVAFGGGVERWRAYDRRYWVAGSVDLSEVSSLEEAKAWVDAVVRLEI